MRFFDLQNLTLFKIRKKHGILEPLHKKIAEPLFLLHFQHIVHCTVIQFPVKGAAAITSHKIQARVINNIEFSDMIPFETC